MCNHIASSTGKMVPKWKLHNMNNIKKIVNDHVGHQV